MPLLPRFVRLIPLVALAFGLTACGSESEPAPGSESNGDRPVIGVSVLTLTHPFFQELTASLESAAEEQGYDVILTSCEFDVARQQNQVADFLVREVDVIVLAPCDSKAIGTSIEAANEAGVPVFTADIASLAEGVDVVAHVATDNYAGGRLAAEALIEAIGGSGKVAIIDHPEVESVLLRTQGFMDVVEERRAAGDEIEVVAQLPGGGVKDRAFRVAEDILQAHADLDGIFAINDDTALGTVAAIEKAGKTGAVQVVGFDGIPEARRAIRDGAIYADVVQQPIQIGRQTIDLITAYRNGEPVDSELLIEADVYDRSDAEQDPDLSADQDSTTDA